MKLSLVANIILEDAQLLVEANVANVKLPIGSQLTIQDYLNKFAEGLADQTTKVAFVKKITSFLLNDERYLHALRQVPDDAPEWAKQAVLTGQLMIFQPDDGLNDKLQHIIHYLAAAEQDSKQTENNDQKVFATGELNGFMKAQTLDLLVTKSNEYFKRGSRNQKRDASGMVQTFDAGEGYIWFELKDAAAYQREGKLLQNCIGSYYTPASANKNHTVIFILRDPQDNSVAAARVTKSEAGGYELNELKGKQNRPPVTKYMPPSIKFLNKMHFHIGSAAQNELGNAGYFYIDGEFYDLPTAIKSFTKATPVGEISDGDVQVVRVNGMPELMKRAYPHSDGAVVYEARTKGNDPLFCFYVNNFNLTIVKSSKETDSNQNRYNIKRLATSGVDSKLRNDMFTLLIKKDLIHSMDPAIQKSLFWSESSVYDAKTGKFGKITPDAQHQLSVEDHNWDEYTRPEIVGEIHKVLGAKIAGLTPETIKQIFVMHQLQDLKLVIIATKDGQAIMGAVKDGEFSADPGAFGYKNSPTGYDLRGREDKDINSLINFANEKKLRIPDRVRQMHGIVHEHNKYSRVKLEPKEVLSDPKVTKYDFSHYDKENKAAVAAFAMDEPEFKNKRYENYEITHRNPIINDSDLDLGSIDALYVVDITYGVDKPHKFTLAVKGNTINHIDDSSKQHNWQNWSDFDKISETINKVKNQLKLNLSPSAANDSKEFKVVDGNLSTKSHDIKQQLISRKLKGKASTEGTDSLPFVDGAKLKLMSPEQQGGWMRQSLGSTSTKGEVWYLQRPNGVIPYAYFVDNKKIKRLLISSNEKNKEVPIHDGYNQESLKYLKGAASTFGWQGMHGGITIEPNDKDIVYRDLKELYSKPNHRQGYLDISKHVAVQRLIRFGLAKRVHKDDEEDKFTQHYWVQLTPAGLVALQQLRKGEKFDGLTHITGKTISDDYKPPVKKEAPAPLARAAEQPAARDHVRGERTKSSMAIDKFREMQAAQGRIPTLSEFKRVLAQAPFNMSELSAQTYYYATKKRVAGQLGEGCHLALAYDDDLSVDIDLPLLKQLMEST